MKYSSLDTEQVSKAEKGEGDHLLSDDLVKPLPYGKKPFNWCRCLCKTLVVLVCLFLVTFIVVSTATYIWMRHQVKRVTIPGEKGMPQPPLPVAPIPDAELEVIKDQAKLFWDELRADLEPSQDLTITQDQMNGLIASCDYLRGHAFVEITEGEWRTDLVLPADKLPGGRGRYFMGNTHAKISSDDNDGAHIETEITPKYQIRGLDYATLLSGKYLAYFATDPATSKTVPIMNVEYGQFLNWVAPQDWIDRHENILDCNNVDKDDDDFDRKDCRELMAVLGRLESISFHDEKIVFKARRSGGQQLTDGGVRTRKLAELEDPKQMPSFKGVARRALASMF